MSLRCLSAGLRGPIAAIVLIICSAYAGPREARAEMTAMELLEQFGSAASFRASPAVRMKKAAGRKITKQGKTSQAGNNQVFGFFSYLPAQTGPAEKTSRQQLVRKTGFKGRSRGKLMTTLKKIKPQGLPLSLAAAVITVESGWRVNARGAAGERGLMQLKPATARLMGVHGNLYHAPTNIRAGTRYLHYCYKRARGNVAATIGCYNLGPGKMWAWNKNRITRRYVSKVRRYVRR